MRADPVMLARALVGTPFRLHGRDPAFGFDCVGLVASVYAPSGDVPTGYALRGGNAGEVSKMIRALGCRRRRCGPMRGDLFVLSPGPAQLHVGIWTGTSLIHADAGARRVVETPGWPRWPLISAWIPKRKVR